MGALRPSVRGQVLEFNYGIEGRKNLEVSGCAVHPRDGEDAGGPPEFVVEDLLEIRATEKFPDLWNQFTDDLSGSEPGPIQTVFRNNDPSLGSNAAMEIPDVMLLNVLAHARYSQ